MRKSIYIVLILFCGFLNGCSFFKFNAFDGKYTIDGVVYNSLEFFNKDLVGNRDYLTQNNLLSENKITQNNETCKKIKHSDFDLFEVYRPKYEEYSSVIVCNAGDFNSLIEFYNKNRNNDFFVGKLDLPSNYVSSCKNIYKVPEILILNNSSCFSDLLLFCSLFEISPLDIAKTNNIKNNCTKFSGTDIKDNIVKIFRVSKDGYFCSNKPNSFLLKDEKLYLFCLSEGDDYFFMPFVDSLQTVFLPIVKEAIKSEPVNKDNYKPSYF